MDDQHGGWDPDDGRDRNPRSCMTRQEPLSVPSSPEQAKNETKTRTRGKERETKQNGNSQTSHHAGVQFTTFPSHTVEFTNHTSDESPLQKMNRHVPAFQLEASVRCQVRGTDADVNAKRAKTVNTWLTPVIFERSLRGKGPGRSYTPCARESMVPVFNVAEGRGSRGRI